MGNNHLKLLAYSLAVLALAKLDDKEVWQPDEFYHEGRLNYCKGREEAFNELEIHIFRTMQYLGWGVLNPVKEEEAEK